MADTKKKARRETNEERRDREAREKAQQRLAEVEQARQETKQRPEGFKSDPERYGWSLVIPVDGQGAWHVAQYAVARMAERLAAWIDSHGDDRGDGTGYYPDGHNKYYVEYELGVGPDHQPSDDALRAMVLDTLRDPGLEAMGIRGAEFVRFQYDDWAVTDEECSGHNRHCHAMQIRRRFGLGGTLVPRPFDSLVPVSEEQVRHVTRGEREVLDGDALVGRVGTRFRVAAPQRHNRRAQILAEGVHRPRAPDERLDHRRLAIDRFSSPHRELHERLLGRGGAGPLTA
jgi:hypothetical protein